MSETKKPRADSVLKTLPEERQAGIAEYARTHTLTETRQWLEADGLKTSEAALSLFLSWRAMRGRLAKNGSIVKELLADLKSENPRMTESELEEAGQMFFSALAIEQEDSLAWKRTQEAKARIGYFNIARQAHQRETAEKFLDQYGSKEAEAIANDPKLSRAAKIQALGKQMFGTLWEEN